MTGRSAPNEPPAAAPSTEPPSSSVPSSSVPSGSVPSGAKPDDAVAPDGTPVAADLFWPGDHRAGIAFSGTELLDAMRRVEAAWLSALVASAIAPPAAADDLSGLLGPGDVGAVAAAGEAGGNPVIPLVELLRVRLNARNPVAAAWLHKGLTSQDVLDTALMLAAAEVLDVVRAELSGQVRRLSELVADHRATVLAGRTLTQHAVPVTFGLKASQWLTALLDAADDLALVRTPAQFGGAAGTLAATVHLAEASGPGGSTEPIDPAEPPGSAGPTGSAEPTGSARPTGSAEPDTPAERALAVAEHAAQALGLDPALPWHTARAPVTRLGDGLVGCTDAWGRIAADVLTLSRPEIAELAEGTGGGSSTMPHKANPVLSVLLRRAALSAPGLGAQLHLAAADTRDERPDGAWHLEWPALRDLARHTAAAARQATTLLDGLVVQADHMRATATAATADLLAERRSLTPRATSPGTAATPAAAPVSAGPRPAEPAGYLGAADLIIDRVLRRARSHLSSQCKESQ